MEHTNSTSPRRTSVEVYKQIVAEGLLSERRQQTYEIIFEHGPLTAAETLKYMERKHGYRPYSSSHGRFTELCNIGVLQEMGERQCSVTGRNVIFYDVTDQLPVKHDKGMTTKEKLQFLAATCKNAAADLVKHGLVNEANEILKNLEIAS